MGRSRLRAGTRCRFDPPLVTVCRRIVRGNVMREWSLRTFKSGRFSREKQDGFGNRVFVFRGVCAGRQDSNRWYEFYVTLYVSPLNKDGAELPERQVHDIIPERSVTKK